MSHLTCPIRYDIYMIYLKIVLYWKASFKTVRCQHRSTEWYTSWCIIQVFFFFKLHGPVITNIQSTYFLFTYMHMWYTICFNNETNHIACSTSWDTGAHRLWTTVDVNVDRCIREVGKGGTWMCMYFHRKLSSCVLKISIFNIGKRYGVTNKK